MSEYNWCHGPECHERKTLDRVRGVKGQKVLRTRKITKDSWNRDSVWSHFCSQGCWNNFMHKHWQEFINLHPRTECLEHQSKIQLEKPILLNMVIVIPILRLRAMSGKLIWSLIHLTKK